LGEVYIVNNNISSSAEQLVKEEFDYDCYKKIKKKRIKKMLPFSIFYLIFGSYLFIATIRSNTRLWIIGFLLILLGLISIYWWYTGNYPSWDKWKNN
jgi:hypothetical protein